MSRNSLRRDEKGASAIEFALAAPAMLMFVIGIAQLGMLCMADAGLRSAVAEGARTASIYRDPPIDDDTILARIADAAWGMQAEHMGEPEITRAKDDEDRDYIEISMSYSAPLNFAFLELDPVELTEVRRVYIHGTDGSSGSSGGSSTSSGASGGTSASSGSSTGGTSASSASSTGSTSSTSAGSTSSTSTGSTSSTSSTSSGNGSNGNSNGNSGHDHGGSNGNGSNGNSNGNGH